jgi:hypothetical protein
MKEQIKNLRIKIDGLAQLTKELKPVSTSKWVNPNEYYVYMDNSQEINKATDSLYLAKAWLGKVLGELGTENPYGSGYKTKEDIVSTQDVCIIPEMSDIHQADKYNNGNHIEKVDCLRIEIQLLITELNEIQNLEQGPITGLLAWNFIYQHLCEARFWLGFEMERIKTENN